jgi:hypothetical protein
MDQNLQELQNNYNYLLESVKNNSMSINDAVKTLENLSVHDASGKLWKMNIHGQFISGYPGNELQPSNAEAFSSERRDNNSHDRNLNIPPSDNAEYFTPYQDLASASKKRNFPQFNIKRARTPIILTVCIFIGLYFFSQRESLPSNEITYEGNGVSTQGPESSKEANSEGNLLDIDNVGDESESTKINKNDEAGTSLDSSEGSLQNDSNYSKEKKEIYKILTSLDKDSSLLSRIVNENDSSNQRLLYEAQLIGYLSVGLKFVVSEIEVKNEIYYYKVEVMKNKDVLLLGEGKFTGFGKKISEIEITWPKFKRVS